MKKWCRLSSYNQVSLFSPEANINYQLNQFLIPRKEDVFYVLTFICNTSL
jgi:hypothetical protein